VLQHSRVNSGLDRSIKAVSNDAGFVRTAVADEMLAKALKEAEN